jgi:WD40-like Beta Propeller Repeat
VKRELQRIEIPGEYDARRRTWEVVRTAYAERERIAWPRRHVRALALAAAGVALVAAAVTPPGRSVVNSVRRAIGVEHAQPELFRLPTSGRLLVQSTRGAWVVQRNGSRRLLSGYREASWSPRGKFISAIRNGHTLVALEPDGTVHWEKPQRVRLTAPRWSFEGFRIAYFGGKNLRVINGNGTGDRLIGPADTAIAPAWRPGTHDVAYVLDGATKVVDVDSGKALRAQPGDVKRLHLAGRPGGGPAAQIAFRRGRSVVFVGGRQVLSGAGRFDTIAWSPDGKWLAVGWPAADQLVFVRVGRKPKLIAVSGVARQFGPAAGVAGWAR